MADIALGAEIRREFLTGFRVIYAWGTNGLIYNERNIAAALPTSVEKNWGLVFDPANAIRLAHCHINTVDTPAAVVPIALSYLRRDVRNPTSQDLNDVASLLERMRPFIHNIDTGGLIEAMANGDACVAIDSNGDAFQARRRAREANNSVKINFVVPDEGSLIWFDLLAIPKDAPHVVNAHRLINYFMDPKVIADMTNYIGVANANLQATALLDPSVKSDPIVYPPSSTIERLTPYPEYTPEQTRPLPASGRSSKQGNEIFRRGSFLAGPSARFV